MTGCYIHMLQFRLFFFIPELLENQPFRLSQTRYRIAGFCPIQQFGCVFTAESQTIRFERHYGHWALYFLQPCLRFVLIPYRDYGR